MVALQMILSFMAGCLGLYIAIWFCILLPVEMAKNRRRSPIGWVLFGFMASPFVSIALLWALGPVDGFEIEEEE